MSIQRTILIVDDEHNMLTVMRMILEKAGHAVLSADCGEAGLAHIQNPNLDVVLTDLKMPGMGGDEFIALCRKERPDVPIIVITAHGTIRSAVESINAGAADYLTKPFEPEALELAVHNALKLRDILRENQRLRATVKQALGGKRLIGNSPAAQALLDEIKRVAPYKTNVLIIGESGTGKELVARTLHEQGARTKAPWVAINCSAIPHDLLESELFGYVKGAFTGAAHNRAGRLEQAQGGTLFLDEIGDMDLSLQGKLLRVLQEREYSPVGSDQVRRVDVRIIAATNRDLKKRVQEGSFREDLYYRLDVYTITVPPLRTRKEDVVLLARVFLHEFLAEMDKPVRDFTPQALAVMEAYPWPGNVRELRNAVERALLSCKGEWIEVADLPNTLLAEKNVATDTAALPAGLGEQDLDSWLEEVERGVILQALAENKGVQAQAARALGITERSLWHRIKKLKIQINRVVG